MNKLITSTIGTGLNLLSYIAPAQTGRIGFELFCYPARPPLQEKHRRFLSEAKYRTLEIAGERVQVYRWGNGPRNIVFAHGWQSHAYRWKPYIDELQSDQYSLYALDAPGHGLSSGRALTIPAYANALAQVCQEAGKVEGMVGHSLGSFTLLYMLHEHTDLMPSKLVLLAPPGDVGEFFSFYQDILQLSDRTVSLTIDHFQERLNRSPEYFSATRFAREIQSEGLIIHDEGDQDTPVENARAIHEAWPSSRLIVTRDFGHNLRHMEVVSEVVDFIG